MAHQCSAKLMVAACASCDPETWVEVADRQLHVSKLSLTSLSVHSQLTRSSIGVSFQILSDRWQKKQCLHEQ